MAISRTFNSPAIQAAMPDFSSGSFVARRRSSMVVFRLENLMLGYHDRPRSAEDGTADHSFDECLVLACSREVQFDVASHHGC